MNIVFRVDASPEIGTGHFMRCLTLATALTMRGACCRFVCRHLQPHLQAMLSEGGHEFVLINSVSGEFVSDGLLYSSWLGVDQAVDSEDTIQAINDKYWDWLIVDHYAIDARWEARLKDKVAKIFVIDDLANRLHDCDALLDQNYYIDQDSRYAGLVPARCSMLLGPRYALLKDEFRLLHLDVKPRKASITRILVFFGGVDADNHTEKVIKILSGFSIGTMAVDVVIGAQHPAREAIEFACVDNKYKLYIQTTKMASLMANSDLAIGAGGIATWERCCLGLPSLVIPIAENQKKQVFDSAKAGLLYAPEVEHDFVAEMSCHIQALLKNPSLLELISANGMNAVDGRGALRVMREMGSVEIKFRLAVESDSQNIISWRNHPTIREVSHDKSYITLESHKRWFSNILQDKSQWLLIGYLDQNHPVGVIRFDMTGEVAKISLYLVPDAGNQGLGGALLKGGEYWLRENYPNILFIQAEVLGANIRSQRLFVAGGYKQDSVSYSKRIQ